jgi:uncharacterized cupin superfamily protein
VPARTSSIYPTAEYQAMVQGRHKRALSALFGVNIFGMNITTIQPTPRRTTATIHDNDNNNNNNNNNNNKDKELVDESITCASSIVHYHTKQDEMIYIISGTALLVQYNGETKEYEEIIMTAGDVMGFPAGRTIGHSIRNVSDKEPLTILEVGDRTKGDVALYILNHPLIYRRASLTMT